MGFFSDLKEDLSQAVNELMPDDSMESTENAQQVSETGDTENEAVSEEVESTEGAQETEMVLEETESVQEDENLPGEYVDSELEEMLNMLGEESTQEAEDEDMSELLDTIEAGGTYKETKGEKSMDVQFSNNEVEDETSVITKGMVITGDILSKGSMDVLGCINGNIDILGKLNVTGSVNGNSKASEVYADNAKIVGEVVSDGSVKIGQSSVIIGNITATSAVVAGAVKGDIDVQGPVILDASAIVMGNIKSKSVQINNGAVIEGMCSQCYADVNPTSFFEDFKIGKNK